MIRKSDGFGGLPISSHVLLSGDMIISSIYSDPVLYLGMVDWLDLGKCPSQIIPMICTFTIGL